MAKDKSGYIIAAAFIGPGTVTTASIAGANFGFHLVWALLFSVFATIVLQDMAARLGIGTGKGLSDCLTGLTDKAWLKYLAAGLIISAIGIGNAAYESGNLTGAAVGLDAIIPVGVASWSLILGTVAGALLISGKYKVIESVLIALVALMAIVFAFTLIVASPDWSMMFSQLISPRLDADTITMILALVGTTIVPYNLFLHASLVAGRYRGKADDSAVKTSRSQSITAIGLGGLITLIIVATAMTAFFGNSASLDATNLGDQLEPVLGEKAQWFFAAGLFAAGLTSTITAPLAAAYAVCGALNRPSDMNSRTFRIVWLTVLVSGIIIACMGFKPLSAILFAQATNGLLLPIIAIFLLVVMNRKTTPAAFRNGPVSNCIGFLVVAFVVALGLYKVLSLIV